MAPWALRWQARQQAARQEKHRRTRPASPETRSLVSFSPALFPETPAGAPGGTTDRPSREQRARGNNAGLSARPWAWSRGPATARVPLPEHCGLAVDRIVRAVSQPLFEIRGHALGRILNHRPAIECDVLRVLDASRRRAAAACAGTRRRTRGAPTSSLRWSTRCNDAHDIAETRHLFVRGGRRALGALHRESKTAAPGSRSAHTRGRLKIRRARVPCLRRSSRCTLLEPERRCGLVDLGSRGEGL